MLSKLLLLVFARGSLDDEVSTEVEDESRRRTYHGPRGRYDESPARDFTIHSVESFHGLGTP